LAESLMYRKEGLGMVQIKVDESGVPSYGNMEDPKVVTILGLGPSGCGKSYLAKQIIPFIEYAQTFVSNDGGTTRECSNVWMMATSFHRPSVNIGNFYNFFKKRADKKKYMDALLKTTQCSVYIPDTWVSVYASSLVPVVGTSITNALNKLTTRGVKGLVGKSVEQPYIGMLIMQHCFSCGKQCPFKDDIYKCVGCDTSGLKRALVEGKKWENVSKFGTDTYSTALAQGYLTLFTDKYKTRTTCPIFVHNSGKYGRKSIIVKSAIDLSRLDPSKFRVEQMDRFPDNFNAFETQLVARINQAVQTNSPTKLSTLQTLKIRLQNELSKVNEDILRETQLASGVQNANVVTNEISLGGKKSKKRWRRARTKRRNLF
jgi:hypothetical protein